ncbi:MAG: hypothetical protein D6714_17775 [Bacteroidetes bacterium]|nr:MAG: hypothetical protein D6714_17775 [Bacteroidota bacterium]
MWCFWFPDFGRHIRPAHRSRVFGQIKREIFFLKMEKAVSLRALKHRRAIFGDLSPEKNLVVANTKLFYTKY